MAEEISNNMLIKPINPYRYAISMILRRLRWDLNFNAISSRRKIKGLRNQYEGKKALILCNGPSLNKVDFSKIDDQVFTFGLNKVNLLFDKVNFRPSAIVAVNDFVIEQNKDFYNSTSIELFLDSKSHSLIQNRSNVTFLNSTPVKLFAGDCSSSISQGGTVTFVAMQLAFHMGFNEVGLVGCDHYFKDKGNTNSVITSGNVDENHFDPNYFAGGQKWQLPDLPQSEYSYAMAKEFFEFNGRKIYNCTDGGYLDIFDRLPLDKFLNPFK